MAPLSDRTLQLIDHLFAADEAQNLKAMLETECTAVTMHCKGWPPEALERLHMAVVRLGYERPGGFAPAVKLAQLDYRDLLMAAGFGWDLEAHTQWYQKMLSPQSRWPA